MRCDTSTFQFINQSTLIDYEKYQTIGPNHTFSANCLDIYTLAFVKLENVCKQYSIPSLCGKMLGWDWDLFVVNFDGKKYRKFCDCKIEAQDDSRKISSMELCPFTLNQKSRIYFVCDRLDTIKLQAFEMEIVPEVKLNRVELLLDGIGSILVQHEMDYLNNKPLRNWAREVDTY